VELSQKDLAQASTMANRTRNQLSTESLTLFPDNTSQQITPQDLRDWLTDGIESFVTQRDTSTFENAFYEARGNPITATSGTTNLALANGNFVHITGTGSISINSFGTLPAGSRFVLCFDIPVTLVYNATSLIIPGAANVTTAAGDCIMLISEGSGNWRVISYFPGGGLPVGTVTAVTASAPLASSGGNAPNLSMPQATGSQDGYLDSADWTTFNNKLDTVDLAADVTGILPVANGGSGTATPSLVAGTNVTITGSWPNQTIAATGGGGGGSPGGANGDYQFKNGGAFDGNNQLRYSSGFVVAHSPKIGDSNSTGHFHMHSANSGPSGINDYLTVFWERANRSLGFRHETETFKNYLKFIQPTADRTINIADASGNVLLDSVLPVLNNGSSEGEIRLKEATANGSNYIGIKSPAALSGDYTLTFPNNTPGAGQVLVSDTSGFLTWSSNPGQIGSRYLSTNATGVVTGTTAETIVQQLLIPAGTYNVGSGMKILFRSTRSPTNIVVTWKFYVSNVINVFSGKPQLGNVQYPNNPATSLFAERNIFISSATVSYYINSLPSVNTDFGVNAFSTANIDWTVDQYIIYTATLASTALVVSNIGISVSPT